MAAQSLKTRPSSTGDGDKATKGSPFRVGRPKSLTKRLVVTFCLLALAAVAVNAKFIADVSWEMTSTKASVGLHVKDQ